MLSQKLKRFKKYLLINYMSDKSFIPAQPLTRSYRLSFRNKTTKNQNYDSSSRLRRLINKKNYKKNLLHTYKLKACYTFKKIQAMLYIVNTLDPLIINTYKLIASNLRTLTLISRSNSLNFLKFNISNIISRPNKQLSQCLLNDQCFFSYLCIITSKAKYISYTEKSNTNNIPTTTEDFLSYYVNNRALLKKDHLITNYSSFNVLRPKNIYLTSLTQASTSYNSSHFDKIRFGSCGIYFIDGGTLSSKFISTARLAVSRKLKKNGRFWIRICADTPVTSRSAETRMGRGKGAISHYEAKITSGMVFMEFSGVKHDTLATIFKELTKKTHLRIKYVC